MLLAQLGHEVSVEDGGSGDADVLVALHARRSAAAIEDFAQRHPDRPLVLMMTGTDLHADLAVDPAAQRSLRLATRIVVLHDRGVEVLPEEVRDKARVIVQSVAVPAGVRPVPQPPLTAVVVGHLREVKDPMRAAFAVRRLPVASRVRVLHLGAVLEPHWTAVLEREAADNPRYQWRGELPREEVLRMVAGSWLHVSSSRMEGGANAVCEALALGVPTLASRIPGAVGLLGEDYPGYFSVGDDAELAMLLARAEDDARFYDELGAATRARADRVLPEREREAIAALLAELSEAGGA